MLLLSTERLPEGESWLYELKLDGYRAIGARVSGEPRLWSRNGNDFRKNYPSITEALRNLPYETVVDGEIVALDEAGMPSFNALQNRGSSLGQLVFYLFDVLVLNGLDLRSEPLEARRKVLSEKVLPTLTDPMRLSAELPGPLDVLIHSARRIHSWWPHVRRLDLWLL